MQKNDLWGAKKPESGGKEEAGKWKKRRKDDARPWANSTPWITRYLHTTAELIIMAYLLGREKTRENERENLKGCSLILACSQIPVDTAYAAAKSSDDDVQSCQKISSLSISLSEAHPSLW
jgi:hypothetical protein